MTIKPVVQTAEYKQDGGIVDNAGMTHSVYFVYCACGNKDSVQAHNMLDSATYFESLGWTYRKVDHRAKCPDCNGIKVPEDRVEQEITEEVTKRVRRAKS